MIDNSQSATQSTSKLKPEKNKADKPTEKKSFAKKPSAKKSARKKSGKALFYQWARTLHIYVSSSLFALLIMFCITGFLLNHDQWFSDGYQDNEVSLQISDTLQQQIDTGWDTQQLPINEIIALVKQRYPSLPQPDNSNIDYELQEVTIDYKVPAGYANVMITPDEQTLSYRKGSLINVIKDLHRGRDAGGLWQWVIDIMAFSIIFFAITGLILMYQNKRKRKAGTIATLVGILTPLIIIVLFVPSL